MRCEAGNFSFSGLGARGLDDESPEVGARRGNDVVMSTGKTVLPDSRKAGEDQSCESCWARTVFSAT
jgi:hypothetical protein